MEPVIAVVRVEEGASPALVHLGVQPELEPMARVLVEAALQRAGAALADPGVYRVTLRGDASHPQIQVRSVAGSGATVAVATYRREAAESVLMGELVITAPAGATPDLARARAVLAEVAASRARKQPVGFEETVEVVLEATP